MSGTTFSTTDRAAVEGLKAEVSSRVSPKRYNHCLGVAYAMDRVLRRYDSPSADETWNGFSVSDFCGIGHDIAREVPLDQVPQVCARYGIELSESERKTPVFAHGRIAVAVLTEIYGDVPASWLRAIAIHTIGEADMSDIDLALFIADFIEPGRTHLTDADRERFLSEPTMKRCALAILRGMIDHELGKGNPPPEESRRMLAWLEKETA